MTETQNGAAHYDRRLQRAKWEADFISKIYLPFTAVWQYQVCNGTCSHDDLVKLCKNTANQLKAVYGEKGNVSHSDASSFMNYNESYEGRNSTYHGCGYQQYSAPPYSKCKGTGKDSTSS